MEDNAVSNSDGSPDNQGNELTLTESITIHGSILAVTLLSIAGSVYVQTNFELPPTGVMDNYTRIAMGLGIVVGFLIGKGIIALRQGSIQLRSPLEID